MGRQVNFYMTDSDEKIFLDFLRSDPKLRIFKDRMTEPKITPLDALPDRTVPGWFILWLWHEDSPPPRLKHAEARKYYVVDSTVSEVIEYSRSYLQDGSLVRGRVWAEFAARDPGDPTRRIQKGKAFSKFFNQLANWIKRTGSQNKMGDYLLPGATMFAADGGRLLQIATSSSVKLRHH